MKFLFLITVRESYCFVTVFPTFSYNLLPSHFQLSPMCYLCHCVSFFLFPLCLPFHLYFPNGPPFLSNFPSSFLSFSLIHPYLVTCFRYQYFPHYFSRAQWFRNSLSHLPLLSFSFFTIRLNCWHATNYTRTHPSIHTCIRTRTVPSKSIDTLLSRYSL